MIAEQMLIKTVKPFLPILLKKVPEIEKKAVDFIDAQKLTINDSENTENEAQFGFFVTSSEGKMVAYPCVVRNNVMQQVVVETPIGERKSFSINTILKLLGIIK